MKNKIKNKKMKKKDCWNERKKKGREKGNRK